MEFREFLSKLEAIGELKRVKREVDPRFEITAILKKMDREKGPSIFCEKVKGYPHMSMVGNVFSTERRIALGVGMEAMDIPATGVISQIMAPLYAQAKGAGKPCIMVDSGAIKDVVITKDVDVLSAIPVPTHCERDGGPYISAGVVVAKHPDTKERAIQVIEMQVKERDKITISPVTPMVNGAYARAEELGQPLPVAIVIGVDPAIMYASCATAGLIAMDKFELAGAIKREPLELVKAETVDLEFPAHAEMVIEGEILPHLREDMGPYGDYLKTYYWTEKKPIVKVKAISHRREAIYQDILGDGVETVLLVAISLEIDLLQNLKAAFPFVQGLYIPRSSSGHHAIISVRKARDEDIKPLIHWVLSSSFLTKYLTVVDDDIDIGNPEEIEWAIVSRPQADRDVLIVPDLYGNPLDPSCTGALGAKMGIDATKSLNIPAERFELSDVPKDIRDRVERDWEGYF